MEIEKKLNELRKVVPYKWRVRNFVPSKANATHANMIAYIDARDVQDLFDNVIGISAWQSRFISIDNRLFCEIGIKINNEWVWKSDRGTESKTEKEKGEASDAFKRAAVMWGVNRDAYKIGEVKLSVKKYGDNFYPCDKNGSFLKKQALFNHCNKMAKINEMENYNIEITEHLSVNNDSEVQDIISQIKETKTIEDVQAIEKIINANNRMNAEIKEVINQQTKMF